MSTLTSASTRADIKAAIKDNASYREDSSLAKAKAFITAVTMWLFEAPKRSAMAGGQELELDLVVLSAELESAKAYIQQAGAQSSSGNALQFGSFASFRD